MEEQFDWRMRIFQPMPPITRAFRICDGPTGETTTAKSSIAGIPWTEVRAYEFTTL